MYSIRWPTMTAPTVRIGDLLMEGIGYGLIDLACGHAGRRGGLNSLDRFNGPDPAKRDPVLPVVRIGDDWRVGGNNLRDKG